MSVQLYSTELQEKLNSTVGKSEFSTRNAWLSQIITIVLELKVQLTSDVLSEMRLVVAFMNSLEWARIHRIYKAITDNELTQRAEKHDLMAAIFREGLKQLEKRYEKKQSQ
ncbi:hypothetical protein S7335_1272 [Synechococcus sp. PCC 7335]|nr:hypothetical protein S7335_1272 [Synechococcus sp. PCC 7335]